ncbi:ABC transporter ATP-binding protein [Robinsoniella sp. KNHs210]|uniref:ABC transporter ATP-binding protein n=1 Tax=Robinsoniella sp. KNHs210 TaxID=1469950 RepID=UPI00048586E6|nr:ABC transporter ATP-binding protein [Robinsoniella sp. KNHs210]
MFKIFKYLKKSAGIILVIVLLLFLQAYCDLSLPDYTSKIVNVGIQQNGIEDAVAETIRGETMDKLFIFMDEDTQNLVKENYTLENNMWSLKKVDKETRDKLNTEFGKPMLMVYGLTSDSDQTKAILAQMKLPEGTDPFTVFAQMPKEQMDKVMEGMSEKLDKMPESIITQSSINFVKSEYQAQGIDMDGMQTNYILKSGLVMLAFALTIMIAAVLVTFLSCRVAASLSRDLREKVFEKVISFSNAEFDKFSTASLITRSTNDIQQVQMLMTMLFRIVLYAPILGIGGVIHALGTNKSMAWIIAVAVGAILVVVSILFSVAMPKFQALQKLIDRLNLVSREILQGVPVIRAFSTEKHEEQRFETANHELMKTNLFVNRCMTFMMPLMMFIMNGITVLIVWKGAAGIDNGNMQVGDLMAFIQYTMMIIMSFLMLTMLSIMLPRASVSATRINEVLETEVILHDPKDPKSADRSKKGIVEFKNVSFTYPEAEESVLSNLNFTAKPGETTAIIGSTGCGKSTLVNLIPRFFDVTQGQILVDGVDVRELSQRELHDKIGYVPQKGVLFSGTIATNLRYGKEDATDEEVAKAAQIAQAYDFIQEKDEKFDSPIAQGGTNVSGGQKQRLSIARAIAKEPEIYIFDDSFSALDYKTDVALRGALKNETKDATTIIVAQRISTILHAEQIIVLDEGKVAGIGTHQELLKNCDVYYQIAASQLSKEELSNE